ncbi:MAG: DUF4190 domain-containing protein [Acidimicrobiales bacterium]
MSLTPQGPGWWQASDLLWYPPEQKPGTVRPQPPPAGIPGARPPYGAPQYVEVGPSQSFGTSGKAIASLVLSIVWIGGLGSLLGVIFGFSARSDIRSSRGRLGGDGLAIAGLIIGLLGLLSAVFFYITLFTITDQLKNDITSGSFPFGSTIPTTPVPTTNLQMGQSSPPFYALAGGRITVYSLRIGVSGEDPSMRVAPYGENFAVANVKECAGAHSVFFPNARRNFTLIGPGNVNSQVVYYPHYVQRPVFDWTNIGEIGPNHCIQGLVGFTLNGNTVTSVVMDGGAFNYSWSVPQN